MEVGRIEGRKSWNCRINRLVIGRSINIHYSYISRRVVLFDDMHDMSKHVNLKLFWEALVRGWRGGARQE